MKQSINQLLELARQNPYFKALLKTQHVSPQPADFTRLITNEQTYFQSVSTPSTIFLLHKPEADCQLLEQRYGYIVVSADSIEKVRFLFNFSLQTLTKRSPPIRTGHLLNHFDIRSMQWLLQTTTF